MAEEAKQEETKKGGKGIIFIIIGVVVLVIILVNVVLFVFLGGSQEEKKTTQQGVVTTQTHVTPEMQALMQNDSLRNPAAIYPIEGSITVNLKSPNPDDVTRGGYLLFDVTLILGDKNLAQELTVKKDIVRSIIISTVISYTSENLQSSQGVQKLKVDIVNNINSILQDGRVSAVVFPNFTLQP